VTRSFSVAANGLTVDRTWKVDGKGLSVVLQVTNATATAATQAVDEVIPKSIASSIRQVVFDSPVPETVRDDPVVRYKVENLAPRANVTFTYRVVSRGVSRQKVDRWADDQARADREHTTLAQLTLTPGRISLAVGQVVQAEAQGIMQDGTAVPLAPLAVNWKSSNPGAAVVFGRVVGLAPGTGAITAKVGDIEAQAPVVVQAAAPAAPGP
jgi:hypothetical protein